MRTVRVGRHVLREINVFEADALARIIAEHLGVDGDDLAQLVSEHREKLLFDAPELIERLVVDIDLSDPDITLDEISALRREALALNFGWLQAFEPLELPVGYLAASEGSEEPPRLSWCSARTQSLLTHGGLSMRDLRLMSYRESILFVEVLALRDFHTWEASQKSGV